MGHEFALVDVFADVPLTGNPLAVVTGADDLDDDQMAAHRRQELNLSETTFVSRPPDPGGGALAAANPSRPAARRSADAGTTPWVPGGGSSKVGPGRAARRTSRSSAADLLPVRIDREHTAGAVTIGLEQGPQSREARERRPRSTSPTPLVGALSPGTSPRTRRRVGAHPDRIGRQPAPARGAVPTSEDVDAVRPHPGGVARGACRGGRPGLLRLQRTMPAHTDRGSTRTRDSSIPRWGSARTPPPAAPPARWRRTWSAPGRRPGGWPWSRATPRDGPAPW